MMFHSCITFILLMLIAIRLDILTEFGVKLFCILSVVWMIGHEIFNYLKRGDEKR